MNRFITNSIRFLMDECLPPIIRDNRFFMYPFFRIWFKGKNIKKYMDFKSNVYSLTDEEFAEFYRNRDSIATRRITDLSKVSINHMLERLDTRAENLLDVGCGSGYFLNQVNEKTSLTVHGCDIVNCLKYNNIEFHEGNVEKLPFADNSFDIVSCHHTLEHVRNLKAAVDELKRVAKYQLIIVVPCQRYFYYTLDEHIRFFPYKSLVEQAIGLNASDCRKVWNDWVFIGELS
jgi:ubiquinone/menaquinone biosynthesis C-methylase UbiE